MAKQVECSRHGRTSENGLRLDLYQPASHETTHARLRSFLNLPEDS